MTNEEWEQAKERGRKTSVAAILNEEAFNFFENELDIIPEIITHGPVSPLPSKQVKA